MTGAQTGRMLLSHNFVLAGDQVLTLDRNAFADIFVTGLGGKDGLTCQSIAHPHWTVEIGFDPANYTPKAVGELCAEALCLYRAQSCAATFSVLTLGGMKTTPATSDSPTALQPNQWGVDVVETDSVEDFLNGIGWDAAIANRPPENIFRVERTVNG